MKRNATVPADFYDALRSQCAASKREVRRLRGWLRWWRNEAVAAFGVRDGFVVGMDDALSGKPAPRRAKP